MRSIPPSGSPSTAVHQQQIAARSGHRVLDAGLHALQHAEQRKGDAHLQEEQNGATRLSPDTGPDEGHEFHVQSVPGSVQVPRPIRAP
jgi:hypothetical protein